MKLKNLTMKALQELANDSSLDSFFSKESDTEFPEDLISKIADMVLYEFDIPRNKKDKVKFFIRLGYLLNED
jgi:hypothetical protein